MKTTVTLTNEAKREIINNKRLRIAIFDRWDIFHTEALQRWVRRDDPRLVHPDTLALIQAYTGLTVSEVTEIVTLEKTA